MLKMNCFLFLLISDCMSDTLHADCRLIVPLGSYDDINRICVTYNNKCDQ